MLVELPLHLSSQECSNNFIEHIKYKNMTTIMPVLGNVLIARLKDLSNSYSLGSKIKSERKYTCNAEQKV